MLLLKKGGYVDKSTQTCVFSAFGYGAEGKWWAKPHTLPFSPTHPYGRKEQRPHKETKTGR